MKSAALTLAACLCLATLSSMAAETAQPSVQREKLSEVSATVAAIDQESRILSLKGDDGSSTTFQVGPEVKNFPQIRVGDKVVVSYYRGIAAELQPKGTPLSKKVDQLDVTTAAEAGTKPGGGMGSAVRATVVIQKADPNGYSVTFKRPDGTSRTLEVKSPEGQNFVAKLKKGDQVEVLYVEAVAVEVRPQ